MRAVHWIVPLALGCAVATGIGACSSDDTAFGSSSSGQAGGGAASSSSGQGGDLFDGGADECTTDEDCNGGVCHNGKCCGSIDLFCGDECCEVTEVCLFEACVTPGDDCVSAADCPEDHYCEPALGEQGAGGAGANCTQPLEMGKCLPLPEICGEGGGGAGGGDCIEACEYHPPAGQLDAVIEWQWGYDPAPTEFPNSADVWATPTVARIFDANCDGKVDMADPPNVVFVSGNVKNTCCSCSNDAISTCLTGVLRMLDGKSGTEIWSLDKAKPGNHGFAGMSVALGDIDGDELLDIIVMTGDGYIAMVDGTGQVQRISDARVGGYGSGAFGWGGGISIGDMDGDGHPEIAYGRTLFETTNNAITRLWVGSAGWGGAANTALSHFVDLDGDGFLELLAGRTAYRKDGTTLWNNGSNDGFTAIGDFDKNGSPEVVVVRGGTVRLLDGLTGQLVLGPVTLPGTGGGGPPTVADFDGDGYPEIGVAQANRYSMVKPDYQNNLLTVVWDELNHDNSSSVTGSSVFDFNGDGAAEVIYNDECYLWVYEGATGNVLFTALTQSFTATEASMVADIDGDGHAEMLQIANGANTNTWSCAHHTDPNGAYPVWSPPPNAPHYRGITAFGDQANSWVGTRTLWTQHTYHVTNVCDPRDGACDQSSYYGEIPKVEYKNWQIPWLNNFRQNVQDQGLFDAPDATVKLFAECITPVRMEVSVRNMGLSGLPAGVEVGVFKVDTPELLLGTVVTTKPLMSSQTEVLEFVAPEAQASTSDTFFARILIDPNNITFHECRDDNNESDYVTPNCVQ